MKKKGLLYQFYLPGDNHIHYIMGTMHVSSDSAYTYVKMAIDKMEACRNYCGEMDLNDPLLADIQSIFMLEDGQSLHDFISPKKYQKFSSICQKAFSISLDELAFFRPIVITNMMAESVLTKNHDLSLDQYLWNIAQSNDLKMHGLESADDQFSIMKKIPIDLQLKGLSDSLKNVSKFRKKVNQLSTIYAEGNIQKLYKISKKSMGSLRSLMIYERNEIMTDRLEEITKTGATFAAVGAAHLGGNKGMLKLLKSKGFKVSLV